MNQELLLKDVLQDKNQAYSLYFKFHNQEYYYTNGPLPGDGFNTNYRLASCTKEFIAYGIITLVNKGLLSFDTKIKDIFNDLPDYFKQISVEHLLHHTSGLLDYEDYLEDKCFDHQLQDAEVLEFLKETNKTYFTPGTMYRYSNTGYILLGLILEKVSNKSIQDYLKEEIFTKLQMNETKVNYEGKTQITNRAYGHILENGQIILKDQYWCSATIGDGGIYSNINDLKKWIHFIRYDDFNNLKDNMLKDNLLPNGKSTQYGMGMCVLNYQVKGKNNMVYTHSGFTIGFNTLVMFSKDLDFELIFLTNLGDTNAEKIRDNVYEALNHD